MKYQEQFISAAFPKGMAQCPLIYKVDPCLLFCLLQRICNEQSFMQLYCLIRFFSELN